MPHLSPLNWLFLPLMFWLILIMMISISWWSQSISFPKMSSSLTTPIPSTWFW